MEYQKITNLLGTTLDEVSRFITKKWVEVHDHSGNAEKRYKPSKQIRFKTSMPRSDLCDFSDAYIVEGKVVANFNKRKNDHAGDFPDDPIPDKIFPEGSTPAQITTARNAARTNAVNAANAAGDGRNLRYYVPNVQIKDFNVLIDGKSFFEMPIKMRKKHTNKLLRCEETVITRQVIYWIMSTFQKITN